MNIIYHLLYPFTYFTMKQTFQEYIPVPANSHSLGVSLTLFEIKYDFTPDFSK